MDNISLKSNAQRNVINVTSDASVYYANISKEAANSASASAQVATQKAGEVETSAQEALEDITALKTASISAITSATSTSVNSVEQAEDEALSSIESASANFSDKNLSNITNDGKNVIRTIISESGSSGGGSWGSITGTLSSQTDLTEALANKLNADYTNSQVPYIVEAGFSGTFHYRKWSDGYLEQTGKIAMAEKSLANLVFPFPYSNSSYACIIGAYYAGVKNNIDMDEVQQSAYSMWAFKRENNRCSVTNYGPQGELSWYVCGIVIS